MACRPLAIILALTLGSAAYAADHPVDGVKLVLKKKGSRERLDFVTRDPTFLFPAVGSADDPVTGTPGGAVVELFSATEGTVTIEVPASGWSLRTRGAARFRFTNPEAPGGSSTIRRMELRQGKTIRVNGRAVVLPLAGPQGALAIRITTGTLRTCARFEGDAVKRDQAGRFVGRGARADALTDCDDATLRPPVCGDGVVEPPFEACDSAAGGCAALGGGGFDPIGCSGECQCCSSSGFCEPVGIGSGIYCCDPDDFCMLTGPGGAGVCTSLLCAGPADCTAGSTCVDGRCCVPHGVGCIAMGYSPPCCGGDVCTAVTGLVGRCCSPAGHACAAAADCCSGACNAGTGTCDP
jgi:hypothetical protein